MNAIRAPSGDHSYVYTRQPWGVSRRGCVPSALTVNRLGPPTLWSKAPGGKRRNAMVPVRLSLRADPSAVPSRTPVETAVTRTRPMSLIVSIALPRTDEAFEPPLQGSVRQLDHGAAPVSHEVCVVAGAANHSPCVATDRIAVSDIDPFDPVAGHQAPPLSGEGEEGVVDVDALAVAHDGAL